MARIDTVRYIGKRNVFNMEVFGFHNFITSLGSVLHNCRYFAIQRTMEAEDQKMKNELAEMEDEETTTDYITYMTGGAPTESYMNY